MKSGRYGLAQLERDEDGGVSFTIGEPEDPFMTLRDRNIAN